MKAFFKKLVRKDKPGDTAGGAAAQKNPEKRSTIVKLKYSVFSTASLEDSLLGGSAPGATILVLERPLP